MSNINLPPDKLLAATQFQIGLKHIKVIVSSLELEGGMQFQRTRELIKSLEAQFETDVKK